jgi:hypothetical protein
MEGCAKISLPGEHNATEITCKRRNEPGNL